ncbi:hypothetical protein AS9A_1159 [Hoyosella subflava DQS3-9A1]|uniref:Uncharacterized protein n=1 Tax=Hoyosella subflava (strain DSM 45089 / JCM 17490 / NBRC 109087 / DQS3-9A1) TaxID=443218 RepID=F6ERN4_HOYSD|nr:hypothetical protein AS9A_1159 [Hoyosella subflava DQS3-9A1]
MAALTRAIKPSPTPKYHSLKRMPRSTHRLRHATSIVVLAGVARLQSNPSVHH